MSLPLAMLAPLVIGFIVLGAVVPANCDRQANGVLRILESNPTYFADPSGKPIVMMGCYTWGTFSSTDFDYAAMLESLKKDGLNYARVWLWKVT